MLKKLSSMLSNALLWIAGTITWLGMLLKPTNSKERGTSTEGTERVPEDKWKNMNMEKLRAMHAAREREVREESERRRERLEAFKQRDRERAEAGRRAMQIMMEGGEEGKAFVRGWTDVWGREGGG